MNERYFAVVNVEQLDRMRLLVANVYSDVSGQLENQIIVAFEGIPEALDTLERATITHVMTSDRKLYAALLADSTISAELKHASQTSETARAVETNADILHDLYGLGAAAKTPSTAKPKAAKWRIWLASHLQNIAIKIGGISQ